MPIMSLESRMAQVATKRDQFVPVKLMESEVKKVADAARKKEEIKADSEFFGQAVLHRRWKALSIAQESGILSSLQQLVQAHYGEENSYHLVAPLIDTSDNKTNQKFDLGYSSQLASWRMQTHLFDGIDLALHPLKLHASMHP